MATTKATELGQLGSKLTVHNNNITLDGNVHGQYAGFDSDFTNALSSNISVTGNIAVTGTVDGRDVAADGTKLDGIEAAATADQTAAEIRTLVGSATNSNVFTDSDHSKLDGIETGATADQTKSDIEGLGIDVPATNLTGTIPAARLSTAVTQAESDDSTKIATTAYVVDKITTLIGGAPSTLNDLNELAAAINDDHNYNSTLTTALATKLPKAGGTMTGNILLTHTVDIRSNDSGGSQRTIARVNSSNELEYGWSGNGPVKFMGGGSYAEKMRIHTNGNVGIGTTSPPNLLTVDSNAAATTSDSISVRNRGITATGHTVGLRFQYNSAVPSAIRTVNTNISNGAGRLGLFTSPDGTAGNLVERLTILPTGFVGIGNASTNPGNPLHINHNGAPSGVVAKIQSNGNPWFQQIGASSSWQIGATPKGWELYNDNTTSYHVAVKSDGDVGIGTRDPADKMHIKNDSGTTVYKAEVNSNSVVGLGILKTGSTNQEWAIADGVTVNGKLQIYDVTDSRSVMTFDGAGNVGIGTTNPGVKLDVAGEIASRASSPGLYLYDSNVTNLYHRIIGGGNAGIEFSADLNDVGAGYHRWDIGPNTRMYLAEAGKLGIGTTSPAAKLHLDTASSGMPKIRFTHTNSGGDNFEIGSGVDGVSNGGWSIRDIDASANRFVIDSLGNVGIDHNAPRSNLHVSSNNTGFVSSNGVGIEGIQVTRLTSSHGENLYMYTSSGTGWSGNQYIGRIESYGNNTLEIGTQQNLTKAISFGANNTERMVIEGAGNVGINKSDPSATLHITNNNVSQKTINVEPPQSGDEHVVQISRGFGSHKGSGLTISGANYTNGTNSNAGMIELNAAQYSGTNTRYIHAYDNSGTDFVVRGDGRVGIGTADPQFKLHVNKQANNYAPTAGVDENIVGFQTSYDAVGSQLLTFSNLNGNWLDGHTGSDSAFGWLWNYQNNVRAGMIYDHRSTEKFQIFSSYGAISFITPDAADSNGVPTDSNMNERMSINPGGSIGMGVSPYNNSKLTIGGTTTSYNATLMFDNNTSGGAEFFMLATDNTWTVGANKFIMGHGAPSSSNVDLEIDGDGNIHTTKERLSVGANYNATTGKRGLRVGRTVINWFNYGSQSSSRYLHIKTNLVNQVGSNPQPTMSMFHIRGYTYAAENIDSMLGFHNWNGTYYNKAYTNNGHRTLVSNSWAPYRSTDNKVVIVLDLGVNTYAGVSIDYLQNYEYTWRDVEVSAYTRSTNTSGVY